MKQNDNLIQVESINYLKLTLVSMFLNIYFDIRENIAISYNIRFEKIVFRRSFSV